MSFTTEMSEVLVQAGVDLALRNKILKIAQELEAEKAQERAANKGPKSRFKYTILVRGDKDLADKVQQGWIVKTLENDDTNTLVSRIRDAAKEQNVSGRKKSIVNKWSEVFQYLKRKFSKSKNWQGVNKEPAQVVVLTSEFINE